MSYKVPQPAMTYSHAWHIPPVSRAQLEQSLQWSLSRLPYRVDTLANEDVVIHLTSGRTVRITPSFDEADPANLHVVVHTIEEADVGEMLAIHENLVENTRFAAWVLWARQNAAA
jgi:hypothetical protein